jgi:hypothetical protein
MTAEQRRLDEAALGTKKWRRWGTYLSERQWGTVREDYSESGDAWTYFPFDHAHLRAYRWGEDGLLGMSDNRGLVCFSVALWNGKDAILKERLFGLTGPEGNHGEDVKEAYFYLDATPTHSLARGLYKYPQRAFPYEALRERARSLGRRDPEEHLVDSGIFDDDRYFDVAITYAKADADDVLIEIAITNRGPETAPVVVLPQLFCRNTWSWGDRTARPVMAVDDHRGDAVRVSMEHFQLGTLRFYLQAPDEVIFTENESNKKALWNAPNDSVHTKDAFHRRVVNGERDAVTIEGSKCAGVYSLTLGPGETKTIRARLGGAEHDAPFAGFDAIVAARDADADELYASITPPRMAEDERRVLRQALSGTLWTKQFYHLDLNRWLRGDPGEPPPPKRRLEGRNSEWSHLYNSEVISMPDKWEYPWYAAWDTAFHALPLALVDLELAKSQLILFLREWYMHPSGQIPAYEWNFSDVNPPVQAWAALRLYHLERAREGRGDRHFLESVFHKLMLNFTWWVNRKDAKGRNVFEGGFMGLDNIGVFDRSSELPMGGRIEQADATSWMGMYCLNLLSIALELAHENRAYEDVANKFFEHFLYIATAMHASGHTGESSLWDEEDGFYYDVLNIGDHRIPMRVRSMVGLTPLFGVEVIEPSVLERFPGFRRRAKWFLENRPDLARNIAHFEQHGIGDRQMLSLVNEERLRRILARLLDESEFLSPYGVRALSRKHLEQPYSLDLGGRAARVGYEPGESESPLFGGNSNWRGPVWMPVNFLLIEALRGHYRFYGDAFRVECPTGSGRFMNLGQIANELTTRLTRLFLRDGQGQRPVFGDGKKSQRDPHFKDHVLFFEYFHGDTGKGLGAAHQTGWTALVANLLLSRITP